MKAKTFILLAALFAAFACDPIEDKSLRNDFENVGTPITKAELEAAISITQPLPNQDGVIAGDQYVVVKNSRPDIPGVWHYDTKMGEKTLLSDNDTIIYEANGTYNAYFVALSANQIVQTDPKTLTVTNVFDEWENIFTGAANKADKAAKKTWEFWEGTNGTVYFNGMFSNWQHYPIVASQIVEKQIHDGLAADEPAAISAADRNLRNIHNGLNAWGATTNKTAAGNYTMTFEYDGSKMITYNPDGSVQSTGNYAYSHESPDKTYAYSPAINSAGGYAAGTLITTNNIPGSEAAWQAHPSPASWWIIYLDADYLVIALPAAAWQTGDFWDHDCFYVFYQAKQD
jgi:hypothetical protein